MIAFPDHSMDPFADVDWAQYDFIDLGCSEGGSLRFCQKRFGARRGVGVDLDRTKVERARAAGVDVILADARHLPREAHVRFVSMMDFLEHLPSLKVVEEIIAAASEVASDFLFIRHPSFEGEAYLASLGLRQYWWHWSGHTAHIRVSDYCTIFEGLGLQQYAIKYLDPVLDSKHSTILTSDMPINQGPFNPSEHLPKPHVTFAEPVWRAQDIFIALRAFEPAEWAEITGGSSSRASLGARLPCDSEDRRAMSRSDNPDSGKPHAPREHQAFKDAHPVARANFRQRSNVGGRKEDQPGHDAALVQPSRPQVVRAAPELWIRDGVPASGFFEYMTVSQDYVDPPVSVQFFPEVYFDSWSAVCLGPSGNVLALNSAKHPESAEVQRHADRIRACIANGDYKSVEGKAHNAILSTSRHLNYYHFLFDDFGRLGYYESLRNFDSLQLVTARPTTWQQEIFRIAGIENRLLPLSPGIYHLRNVWMAPRGLSSIMNFRTRAFDQVLRIRDQLKLPATLAPERKVYISREGTRHRRLLNEAEIQNYMRTAGFEVVRPETLSVRDQVRLFNEAKVVIGVFGAGLTNAAFMCRGMCLLEIAPPTTQIATAHNAIFSTLCGLRELRFGLAVGSDKDFDENTHDFSIPTKWIERLVSQFVSS